jgi:uncharacterized protein (DUF302 family)
MRAHTHTQVEKKKEPVGDNGLPCRVFLPEGGDTLWIYFSSNEYIASGKKKNKNKREKKLKERDRDRKENGNNKKERKQKS